LASVLQNNMVVTNNKPDIKITHPIDLDKSLNKTYCSC